MEMVGWHHWLDGHEFEEAPGVDGQKSLACCGPWGCKELDTTEWLNWTVASKKRVAGWESIDTRPISSSICQDSYMRWKMFCLTTVSLFLAWACNYLPVTLPLPEAERCFIKGQCIKAAKGWNKLILRNQFPCLFHAPCKYIHMQYFIKGNKILFLLFINTSGKKWVP